MVFRTITVYISFNGVILLSGSLWRYSFLFIVLFYLKISIEFVDFIRHEVFGEQTYCEYNKKYDKRRKREKEKKEKEEKRTVEDVHETLIKKVAKEPHSTRWWKRYRRHIDVNGRQWAS